MPTLTMAALPLIAFAITAFTMPLAKWIARRYGVVSVPYTEARHQEQKPLMGGAAIIVAILATLAVGRVLPLWMLAGTAGLFVVGMVDDALVLRPRWKLLLQIVVVLFVIAPLLFAVWRRMPCADASAAPSPARLPRMDPSHPHSRVRDLATDEVDGEADEQNAEGALHRLGRKVLRES